MSPTWRHLFDGQGSDSLTKQVHGAHAGEALNSVEQWQYWHFQFTTFPSSTYKEGRAASWTHWDFSTWRTHFPLVSRFVGGNPTVETFAGFLPDVLCVTPWVSKSLLEQIIAYLLRGHWVLLLGDLVRCVLKSMPIESENETTEAFFAPRIFPFVQRVVKSWPHFGSLGKLCPIHFFTVGFNNRASKRVIHLRSLRWFDHNDRQLGGRLLARRPWRTGSETHVCIYKAHTYFCCRDLDGIIDQRVASTSLSHQAQNLQKEW